MLAWANHVVIQNQEISTSKLSFASSSFQKPDGCTVKKCTNPMFVHLILLCFFWFFHFNISILQLDHTYAFPVQTSTFPPSRYGVAAAPVPRRAAAAPRSAGASCGDPSDRLDDPPGFDKDPRCAVAHEEPRQCDLTRWKDVGLVFCGLCAVSNYLCLSFHVFNLFVGSEKKLPGTLEIR